MRRYQARWLRSRRAAAVVLLGGKCSACNSTERLEIDHIDPKTKVSHRMWTWPQARIDAELAKCQLLCNACHVAKSAAEKRRPLTHGTAQGYRRGCRCLDCRDALYFSRTGIRRGPLSRAEAETSRALSWRGGR